MEEKGGEAVKTIESFVALKKRNQNPDQILGFKSSDASGGHFKILLICFC